MSGPIFILGDHSDPPNVQRFGFLRLFPDPNTSLISLCRPICVAYQGIVISAATLFWSDMPDWDPDAEVQILFFASMAPKSQFVSAYGTMAVLLTKAAVSTILQKCLGYILHTVPCPLSPVPVLHTLLSFEVLGGSEDSGGWNFDSDSRRNAFMYLRCHYEYCMDQLDTSFAKLAKTDPLSISYADFRLALQEMGISESPLTGSRTDLKHFLYLDFFPEKFEWNFKKSFKHLFVFLRSFLLILSIS